MLLLRSYEETHPSRCEFSGEKGVVLVCSSTACAGELLVLGMRKGQGLPDFEERITAALVSVYVKER